MVSSANTKDLFVVKVGDKDSTKDNATTRIIDSLSVDGTNAKLIKIVLSGAVITNQQKLFVSYTPDDVKALKAQTTGVEILGFEDESVTNDVVPRMSISPLNNDNKNKLIVSFDVEVTEIDLETLTLKVDDQNRLISNKDYTQGTKDKWTQVQFTINGSVISEGQTCIGISETTDW